MTADTGTPHPDDGGVVVPETIVCVDCGGTCGLLGRPDPEIGWQPGDVASYRCGDCWDRWDLVVDVE